MNEEFRNHMAAGGSVEVDIAVDGVTVTAGDRHVRVDLRDKAMRRLLEHASLVEEAATGTTLLNR